MDTNESSSASNELTSTAESVLTSDSEVKTLPNNECALAGDSVPSSSSDANVQPTIEKNLQEDPISSTSDTNDLNVCQTTLDLVEPSGTSNELGVETDYFSSELNMENISTEKIAEDVEDIANDLENLLGETTNDFTISIPRQKEIINTVPPKPSTSHKSLDETVEDVDLEDTNIGTDVVVNQKLSVEVPEAQVVTIAEDVDSNDKIKNLDIQHQEKEPEILIIGTIETKEESNLDNVQPNDDNVHNKNILVEESDKPALTEVDSSSKQPIVSKDDQQATKIEDIPIINETPTERKEPPNEDHIEDTVVEDTTQSDVNNDNTVANSLPSEQVAIAEVSPESTDKHNDAEDSTVKDESQIQQDQSALPTELHTNESELIITQTSDVDIKLQNPENISAISEISNAMDVDQTEESVKVSNNAPKVVDTATKPPETNQELPQEAMETEETTEHLLTQDSIEDKPIQDSITDKPVTTGIETSEPSDVIVAESSTDSKPDNAVDETSDDTSVKNEDNTSLQTTDMEASEQSVVIIEDSSTDSKPEVPIEETSDNIPDKNENQTLQLTTDMEASEQSDVIVEESSTDSKPEVLIEETSDDIPDKNENPTLLLTTDMEVSEQSDIIVEESASDSKPEVPIEETSDDIPDKNENQILELTTDMEVSEQSDVIVEEISTDSKPEVSIEEISGDTSVSSKNQKSLPTTGMEPSEPSDIIVEESSADSKPEDFVEEISDDTPDRNENQTSRPTTSTEAEPSDVIIEETSTDSNPEVCMEETSGDTPVRNENQSSLLTTSTEASEPSDVIVEESTTDSKLEVSVVEISDDPPATSEAQIGEVLTTDTESAVAMEKIFDEPDNNEEEMETTEILDDSCKQTENSEIECAVGSILVSDDTERVTKNSTTDLEIMDVTPVNETGIESTNEHLVQDVECGNADTQGTEGTDPVDKISNLQTNELCDNIPISLEEESNVESDVQSAGELQNSSSLVTPNETSLQMDEPKRSDKNTILQDLQETNKTVEIIDENVVESIQETVQNIEETTEAVQNIEEAVEAGQNIEEAAVEETTQETVESILGVQEIDVAIQNIEETDVTMQSLQETDDVVQNAHVPDESIQEKSEVMETAQKTVEILPVTPNIDEAAKNLQQTNASMQIPLEEDAAIPNLQASDEEAIQNIQETGKTTECQHKVKEAIQTTPATESLKQIVQQGDVKIDEAVPNLQVSDEEPMQDIQETGEAAESLHETEEVLQITPETELVAEIAQQGDENVLEDAQSIHMDAVMQIIPDVDEATQKLQKTEEAIQTIQGTDDVIPEPDSAMQITKDADENDHKIKKTDEGIPSTQETDEAIQSIQEVAEIAEDIQQKADIAQEADKILQEEDAAMLIIPQVDSPLQSLTDEQKMQEMDEVTQSIRETDEAIQSIQGTNESTQFTSVVDSSIHDGEAVETITETDETVQSEIDQAIQIITETDSAILSIQEDDEVVLQMQETNEAIQSIQEANENVHNLQQIAELMPITTEIQSAVESIQDVNVPDMQEIDLAAQIIQETDEAIKSIQGAGEDNSQEMEDALQCVPEIDKAIQSIQEADVYIPSIEQELNECIGSAIQVQQVETIQAELTAVDAQVDDETVEAVQSIQEAFGFETSEIDIGDTNPTSALEQLKEYNDQEISDVVQDIDEDATKQAINSIQLIEENQNSETVANISATDSLNINEILPADFAETKVADKNIVIKSDLVANEQVNEVNEQIPDTKHIEESLPEPVRPDTIEESTGDGSIPEDITESKTEMMQDLDKNMPCNPDVNDDHIATVDSSVPNVICMDEGNIAALAIQDDARDVYAEDEVMSTQELPQPITCQKRSKVPDLSAVEEANVTSTNDAPNSTAIVSEPVESSDDNAEPQESCKPVEAPLVIDINSSEETRAVPEISTSQYSSKMSEKESLKMTITKHRVDSPKDDDSHSILKIYDPKEDSKRERSKGKDTTVPKLVIKPVVRSSASPTVDDSEQGIPKLFIRNISKESPNRPGSPKVSKIQKSDLTSPLKLTIKPVLKPDENQCRSSPKLHIKPIVKPEDESCSFTPKITIKPIIKPDDEPVHSPKITIKPIIKPDEGTNDMVHSPRITIKAIPKPEEIIETHSPKITIKPLVRPEDKDEDRSHSPRVTIKPVVKHDEPKMSDIEAVHSPRITIKPIIKPPDDDEPYPKITIKPSSKITMKAQEEERRDKKEGSPKIKIKAIVKPPEMDCGLVDFEDQIKQERIVLKINKNASTTKESRKREATEEIEKLAKIKLKFSKEGGHAHIVSEQTKSKRNLEESPESNSKRMRIETVDLSSSPENSRDVIEIKDDSSAPLDDPMEAIPVFEITPDVTPVARTPATTPSSTPQQPRKRGRPRKVPLVVREEFKDVKEEESPQPVVQAVSEETGRPKRSCRGPSVCTTLGIKPRKPRGGGAAATTASTTVSPSATSALSATTPTRGRGRGRGSRGGGSRGGRQQRLSAAKVKLLQEEAAAAIAATSPPPPEVEEIETVEPDAIIEIFDDDIKEEELPPEPLPQTEIIEVKTPAPELTELTPPIIESVTCESSSDVVLIEEETRMSADISTSRAPTPAKQVLNAGDIDDTQSSVLSTATSESTKVKKGSRLEVHQEPEGDIISPDQLAEYYWGGGGPYMLQEQVAQFLGIKSFKRKYPGIQRRPVDMQERDFIRESALASEAMCDMGLTAVNSADILDIMYSDFQHKYEEYCKHQRDRQAKEVINKQRALSLAASQEKSKQDMTQSAVHSAAAWNSSFNKTRREERRACMDLQTFTVNYPKGKFKNIDKPKMGNYPVALVPGQYTDHYKTYSPNDLYNLPLNTMMNKPIPIQSNEESQSDGSESDSDSSSSGSDSSSSDSSDDDCNLCSPPSSGAKKMVAS